MIGIESNVNYCSSVLLIRKSERAVIGQKDWSRSHLHNLTYQYWLIMNHGCMLSYDWSSCTMLIKEWGSVCGHVCICAYMH